MRKRKSDELSAIDLSELDSSSFYKNEEFEMVSPLTPPKNALENIGDVFSGMNARWQQAFQPDIGRPPRPEVEAEKSFHPLSGSGIFTKPKDPPGAKNGAAIAPSTPVVTKTIPTPLPPSFQHFREASSGSNEGDSPCSVAALTRGCGACFWERSLAWSEDDDSDDDSIVHSRTIRRSGSITEHLSVPKHLGKEFAETKVATPNTGKQGGVPLRRPSMSRTITLESDSRHKLPGAKMFRQTDVDKVTEIHWEEKILDTTTIDLMAQLSL